MPDASDRHPSRAAASRAYRQRFLELHGVGFNAARRLGRELGIPQGRPAEAARAVTSTAAGAELLGYRGDDTRRRALQEAAFRAADFRSREFAAVRDLQRGAYATTGEAERRHGLPSGSLSRDFSAQELSPGGRANEPMVMLVLTSSGPRYVVIKDQAERERVGKHWTAVSQALRGQPAALRTFENVDVAGVPLATSRRDLRAWHEVGLLETGPYPEARG